jgi:hypothetical protein
MAAEQRAGISKVEGGIRGFDPITNLTAVGSGGEVKSMTSRLLDYLKSSGTTSLLTTLVAGGQAVPVSEVGLSSLMDTWIDLQRTEMEGEQSRLIRIIKSRGMAHSNQVREFLITETGIDLVDIYVAGDSSRSRAARANLERICRATLGDCYAIEVLDLLEHPELWRRHQVLATPTVIRRSPNPERRVIGDLSVTEQVLRGLDIPRSVKPAAGAVESTTRNEPPEVQRG